MRCLNEQKTGILQNATVWLLTVAFLFWGLRPLSVAAKPSDPAAILAEGLTDCLASIDLRGASLPVAELGSLYRDVLLAHPQLFHVAPRLSCGYVEATVNGVQTRVVTYVSPVYTMTGTELTAARALYRETVTSILSAMETAFGDHPRTEADTVLYLHDTLAQEYAYDTRPEANANADAYTFFRDGVGICQAYALAFLALARGAGLEAHIVTSDGMDHAWNHVRVEGEWYHVDVTRDDPIPAAGGAPTVTHTRLLRSDKGLDQLGYYGYTCPYGHTCTDTRFEGADNGRMWGSITQKMEFSGGRWLGEDQSGGIVAIKLTPDGVFGGQVGDVDLNGEVDPRDLLALYDPRLPETWREWMRRFLVTGE